MTNVTGSIAAEERLRWLADQLTAHGSITLAVASKALGVSEMTVRRDLDQLEEQGTARRVRGGARVIGPQPFAERRQVAARAKGRIASKLALLLPEEGTVAFDASSTVIRLTSSLQAARDLTVLTNGPDTFAALHDLPGVHALLTGGALDERTGSLVGPLAYRSAGQIAVQVFFASAAALKPDAGAFELTLEEAEVKRAIAAGADRVVLAIDSSKLGARGVAVGLPWDQIDTVVTELDPASEQLAPYRDLARLL